MKGIETIAHRIEEETSAEIEQILNEARAEAARIRAEHQTQADREVAELNARSDKDAAEREERLVSVAHMEARKVALAGRQDMVSRAFARALEKLCAMPEADYVEVLAQLMVQAAKSGREEVILSPTDRQKVGKAAVSRANELLALAVAPKLPDELRQTRLGAILSKVAVGVSALAQGTAMLSLSEQTRDIRGGFLLADGNVEVNCTFETLIRLQRSETAAETARILFG